MAENNKTRYEEISNARVSDNRSVVISSCSKGGYTMAQRMEISDGKQIVSVFLKGAIHIKDKEGLENVRDAINVVLEQIGNTDEQWDDD